MNCARHWKIKFKWLLFITTDIIAEPKKSRDVDPRLIEKLVSRVSFLDHPLYARFHAKIYARLQYTRVFDIRAYRIFKYKSVFSSFQKKIVSCCTKYFYYFRLIGWSRLQIQFLFQLYPIVFWVSDVQWVRFLIMLSHCSLASKILPNILWLT